MINIGVGVIPPFMRYLYWKAPGWSGFVRDCGSLQPPFIAQLPGTQLVRMMRVDRLSQVLNSPDWAVCVCLLTSSSRVKGRDRVEGD